MYHFFVFRRFSFFFFCVCVCETGSTWVPVRLGREHLREAGV